MKCKICNGSGTLEIENDSEYDEGFCDCGNCGGTGVVKKKSPQNLAKADAYSLLADVRAWIKQNAKDPDTFYVDEQVVSIDKLDDFLFKYISEHFS